MGRLCVLLQTHKSSHRVPGHQRAFEASFLRNTTTCTIVPTHEVVRVRRPFGSTVHLRHMPHLEAAFPQNRGDWSNHSAAWYDLSWPSQGPSKSHSAATAEVPRNLTRNRPTWEKGVNMGLGMGRRNKCFLTPVPCVAHGGGRQTGSTRDRCDRHSNVGSGPCGWGGYTSRKDSHVALFVLWQVKPM